MLDLFPYVFFAVSFVASYFVGYSRGAEDERERESLWMRHQVIRERNLAEQAVRLDDLFADMECHSPYNLDSAPSTLTASFKENP